MRWFSASEPVKDSEINSMCIGINQCTGIISEGTEIN